MKTTIEKTKKCKYCQADIPAKATVCPNCKRTLRSVSNGVLLLAVFTIVYGIYVINGAKNNALQQTSSISIDKSIATKYINVTTDEGRQIDTILSKCGITNVSSFEHDELLDNAHSKGETGYRISTNVADNIILYLKKDNSIHSIVYAGNKLYKKNKVTASLHDYVVTSDEASKWQILCRKKVEKILKSPSTAKFPSITEWGFGKKKNKIIVQGYVDAQNGFGAEIRSKFQFKIDTKTETITSFIFDGEELIK